MCKICRASGQNFLIESWVPEDIAAASGADRQTGVLEIGPGIGPLTSELAKRAGRVVSVELDRSLLPILAETLAEYPNVEIVPGDVMKLDLNVLIAERFQGLHPIVCANLPYNITTPLLTRVVESRCFDSVTVLIQKEVAQRIAAKPGTADYGAFSIFCQYYAEPEYLFDVPPHCFLPQPKVTSAVVTLRVRQERPWDIDDPALFFRVVRASFAMRRKKLSNGLASGFPGLGKRGAEEVLSACGFDANVRGETLGIPEFAAIARQIQRRRDSQ